MQKKANNGKEERKNSFFAKVSSIDTGLCKFLILVSGIFFLASILLLGSMWLTTVNRLNYVEFHVTMTEKRVRPIVPADQLIQPPPFATGEVVIDYTQLEVRWDILHQFGDGLPSPVSSLDIRGPISQKNEDEISDVAPVLVGLGLGKHRNRYRGVLDIENKIVTSILKRPNLYYVSFSDETGREIARDSLDKINTSLLYSRTLVLACSVTHSASNLDSARFSVFSLHSTTSQSSLHSLHAESKNALVPLTRRLHSSWAPLASKAINDAFNTADTFSKSAPSANASTCGTFSPTPLLVCENFDDAIRIPRDNDGTTRPVAALELTTESRHFRTEYDFGSPRDSILFAMPLVQKLNTVRIFCADVESEWCMATSWNAAHIERLSIRAIFCGFSHKLIENATLAMTLRTSSLNQDPFLHAFSLNETISFSPSEVSSLPSSCCFCCFFFSFLEDEDDDEADEEEEEAEADSESEEAESDLCL